MRTLLSALSLTALVLGACNSETKAPASLPPSGLAGGGGDAPPTPAPGTPTPSAPTDVVPGSEPGAMPSAGPHGGLPQALGASPHALPTPGAPLTPPGAGTDANIVVSGNVLETMDVAEYTYVRLKLAVGGEEWAAVSKTPIAVGDTITLAQSIVMTDFHSSSLNRTFPRIVFGQLMGAPKKS